MNYQKWFDENAHELQYGGLWLRGGEFNTLPQDEVLKRDLRALFVRLSTYYDTGYSFTHQILYQIASGTPGVYPDLGYLPPKSDLGFFKKGNVPWLIGSQSKNDFRDFDLVGFSNSIVQELLNLPQFYIHSGIPLQKKDRLADPSLPLFILGGANALYSSSIWGERGKGESLIDGIFVGESDHAFRKILEIVRDGKRSNKTKQEVLSDLETIPGFFQPDEPKPTKKGFIPNLNQSEALEKGPVYFLEDQLGSSHLQISEGCPCFCSFCAESWDRKPYRERASVQLLETALRAKAAMGLERIDIYSFNFNMHSGFYDILWKLVPHFRTIGLKSQRFDLLAQDPQMIEFQHAIEKASITCGLEGISPRLRKYLHKNLESDQLHHSLTAILKSKARELKVFLIATGLEEDQDFEALTDFMGHLSTIRKNLGANTRVVFSMTPLVRFPWTPLEFENAFTMQQYDAIIKKAKATIARGGFEFRESADLPEYWTSQVLVRASDSRVTNALVNTIRRTDFIYYREIAENFRSVLEQELTKQGLNIDDLLKGYSLEDSYKKPWAQIETGVKREFLWEEVERARTFKEIDYCLGKSWTEAKCFHCGGCPTRFHVRDIVLSKQKRDYTLDQFKERLSQARKQEVAISFLMNVGLASHGTPRKMLGVALARAIMLTDPSLTPYYRGFSNSFWQNEEKPVWVTGKEQVTLFWNQAAIEKLQKHFNNPLALEQINRHLGEKWGTVISISDSLWKPEKLKIKSPSLLQADSYLKSKGLKFTLKKNKEEDGHYIFEFTKDSMKKGIFSTLESKKTTLGYDIDISPGPKFNLDEFLEQGFKAKKISEKAKIHSVSY